MTDSSYQSMAQDSQQKITDLESRLAVAEKVLSAVSEVPWRFRSKKTNEALAAYDKAKGSKS